MNKKIIVTVIVVLLIIIIITGLSIFKTTGVSDDTDYSTNQSVTNPNYVHYKSVSDIQHNKQNLKGLFKLYYDKYIVYTAPNKKNIYIIATKDITDIQLLYGYSILYNFLNADNNYDMDALANNIANSGSYIIMANGSDGDSSTPMFAILGQPLYYNEIAAPGTAWFMENDYEHRDATFEEILHFTHDNGIGTTQNEGVFPEYATQIKNATFNALPEDKSKWGIEGLWPRQAGDHTNTSWLLELEKEGSLEQEYLASVIDSFYGLWGPYTESDGGMWGMYIAKTREDIELNDPMGYELLPYFNEYLSSMITFDASLDQDLYLSFKENKPYTYKTQYYKYIRLTGENHIDVYGNNQDNVFIGNNGNNHFDGVAGTNVVQYDGMSSDYNISTVDGVTTVTNINTDVTDTLNNIQIIRFKDTDISI